jgi:hypothetical protein
MKKLIFILFLFPTLLFGQSSYTRNVVSGNNVTTYRGSTLLESNSFYNVKSYGAISDSTTDATASFRLASIAAGTMGTVLIPEGAYKLTDSVQFLGNVIGDGARIYVSDTTNKTYVVLGRYGGVTYEKLYRLPKIIQSTHDVGNWGRCIAVKAVNLKGCEINMPYVGYFSKGFYLIGYNNGSVYNRITIGTFYDNKVGITYWGKGTGWVNDNIAIGGQIQTYSGESDATVGHIGILLDDCRYAPESNIFFKIGIEDDKWQYNIRIYGRFNTFYNCRLESTTPKVDIQKYYGATEYSGGNTFTGFYTWNITFSGDALSIAMSKVDGVEKLAMSHYDTSPILNVGNTQNSSYPSFSIWPSSWNMDNTLTTWGVQLGQQTSKYKATGDANERFRIDHLTGNINWGSGSAATDVDIHREGVGVVHITDALHLTPTADPPAVTTEGTIYMDTDHHLYVHNGTGWVQLDN